MNRMKLLGQSLSQKITNWQTTIDPTSFKGRIYSTTCAFGRCTGGIIFTVGIGGVCIAGLVALSYTTMGNFLWKKTEKSFIFPGLYTALGFFLAKNAMADFSKAVILYRLSIKNRQFKQVCRSKSVMFQHYFYFPAFVCGTAYGAVMTYTNFRAKYFNNKSSVTE
jgi:hypothetical protein